MKAASAIHRIIFYAVAFGATYIILNKLNLSINGESGFRLFFYISALTGIIQTINLSIFKKSEDIRNTIKLSYLAGLKLKKSLKDRRETAFLRSIGGIGFALLAAAASSAMNYYGNTPAPLLLFCAASFSTLISIVMLVITLYEFKSISDLESELLDMQEQRETTQKALDGLREPQSDD